MFVCQLANFNAAFGLFASRLQVVEFCGRINDPARTKRPIAHHDRNV